MNLYTIEYEIDIPSAMASVRGLGYRHTTISADTARLALDEFFQRHPEARDVIEVRRTHVR